jgi:hypothetical protein
MFTREKNKSLVVIATIVCFLFVFSIVLIGISKEVKAAGPDITAVASGDVYDMNDGKNNDNPNGDTWVNTWAANDDSWVTMNDGAGWDSGTNYAQRGVSKLNGNPNLNTSTFWGTNLNPGTLGTHRADFNDSALFGYHFGVFDIGGVLYNGIENANSSPWYSAFIYSTDGGVNWYNHLGQLNTRPLLNSASNSMFTGEISSIVRYGKGSDVPNIDNASNYLYLTMDYVYLGRVLKTNFAHLNKSEYTWYSGWDGSNNPIWSANQSSAVALSGLNPRNGGTHTSANPALPYSTGNIEYNYGLQKYVVLAYSSYWPSGETPDYYNWGSGLPKYHVLTSDHVWGPFVEDGSFSLWGSTVAEYLLSNKYTSSDGKKMWIVTSGSTPSWTGWNTHSSWHYGFQYMPLYLSTGSVVRYEAESATKSGNVNTQSTYPAKSGSGYVAGITGAGDKLTFNLNTNVNGAGWHIVNIRYTNPSNNANTLSVYVNGTKAKTISLAQNNSDNSTFNANHEWTNKSLIYYLNSGTSNTFEIRSDTGNNGNGVLIDYIDVSTETTYNEGQNLAPAATTVTQSSGSGANAKKGYVDYLAEWTATGAVNEWMNLSWGTAQTINKVVLYGKANAATQVTSGRLTFSDGSTVAVGKLQKDGMAGTVIAFTAKSTTSVKFTVNSVASGTTNAGLGDFQVYYDTNLTAGSGSTEIDDANGSITYSGSWTANSSQTGYYNNTLHYSNTAGSYEQYTFTGTTINWIGAKNNDHGKVDIYIDGIFDATVDTYSATWDKQQTLYTKTGLSNASHTIKIQLRSDKNASSTNYYTDVDAFIYSSTGSPTPTPINDNDAGITYSGSWTYSTSRGFGDYLDDVHYTTTNNDYFQYTFNGTGIDLYSETDMNRGNVDIYIDGVYEQTISCYSASLAVQQKVYSKSGLASGSHTIKGVKTSATYMAVDKLVIQVAAGSVLNDNDAGITYTGSWTYSPNRGFGDYLDDVHYTTVNNDYFQYTFNGTGVDLYSETNTDRGNVDIYIDGIFQQTVNCYNASLATQQMVYSKSGLTSGSHTIKVVKTSAVYMALDKLVTH